jgi:hypothetical protein
MTHDVLASERTPDDDVERTDSRLDWSLLGVVLVAVIVIVVIGLVIAMVADINTLDRESREFGDPAFDPDVDAPQWGWREKAQFLAQLVPQAGTDLTVAAIVAVGVNQSRRRTMPPTLCVIAAMLSAAIAGVGALGGWVMLRDREPSGFDRWTARSAVAGGAVLALVAAVAFWREAVAVQPFVIVRDEDDEDEDDEDEDDDEDDGLDDGTRLIPDPPR